MRKSREVCIVIAIVIWFTALILIFHNQTSLEITNDERLTMNRALQEMTQLQKQNDELRHAVESFRKLRLETNTSQDIDIQRLRHELTLCKSKKNCSNQQKGTGTGALSTSITEEHEKLLRRSKNNLVEMWYAFERQLNDVKNNPNSVADKSDKFKANFATQLQAAIIDVEDLQSLNDEWREKEAKELVDLIQSRIMYLQNPNDCDSAKKLVCNLNKACGFGCQLHHLAYCAMVAYGTERTLVIDSRNWRYNSEGWHAVFQPASQSCTKAGPTQPWRGEAASKNMQNVLLPIVDGVSNPPPYLPLGFPEDIGHRLLRLHGNPSVWWTGQFVHYLMRPQSWLEEVLHATIKTSGFESPCVGIHVRRTDKVGTEAAFHSIEEYMKHVIAWYDKLDLRLSKEKPSQKAVRRVYLASDDSSVLPEARKKYPDYVFYGDTKIAESAGLSNRYSKDSLRGVLVDIFMLSKCDFLSCTFSSQVCRVAYELMQVRIPDASDRFHSLDDIYYYGGQTGHEQRALYPHKGTGQEISFEVGDVVGIAGNHWDGYSKGTNKRTRQTGLYPSYKFEEIFRLVQYPTFEEIKSKR